MPHCPCPCPALHDTLPPCPALHAAPQGVWHDQAERDRERAVGHVWSVCGHAHRAGHRGGLTKPAEAAGQLPGHRRRGVKVRGPTPPGSRIQAPRSQEPGPRHPGSRIQDHILRHPGARITVNGCLGAQAPGSRIQGATHLGAQHGACRPDSWAARQLGGAHVHGDTCALRGSPGGPAAGEDARARECLCATWLVQRAGRGALPHFFPARVPEEAFCCPCIRCHNHGYDLLQAGCMRMMRLLHAYDEAG